MKKENELFTESEVIKNEPPVEAYGLLTEIKPLLEDYFVGEISISDEGIIYCLYNGQRFIFSVKEVK